MALFPAFVSRSYDIPHFGQSFFCIMLARKPGKRSKPVKKLFLLLLWLLLGAIACGSPAAEPPAASQTDASVVTVYLAPT